MSNAPNRGTIIGVWFAVLASVAGAGAVGGASITLGARALLWVAWFVPPAIMLMVWRAAPQPTVAGLLHAVDPHVSPSHRLDTTIAPDIRGVAHEGCVVAGACDD